MMLKIVIKGEGECSIVGYEGDSLVVSIPEFVEIEGKQYCVTEIGEDAFANKKVTTIEVPATVKKIGNYAFYYNRLIEKIILNEGLEEIGECSFEQCEKLAEICIPQSVTVIGKSAFEHCRNLTTVQLPTGLTRLSDNLFMSCSSLSNINFPKSITHVGRNAFSSCSNLPDLNLQTLEEIGDYAFFGCAKFEPKILYYANNTKCYGWVGDTDKCVEIEIDPTVSYINTGAFFRCMKLKSVSLPDGLKTLGIGCFAECKSLENISLPESITDIADYTFASCHALTQVNLPSKLQSIGYSAFGYCLSLAHIKIPDSVTSIADAAFMCCKKLENVEMSPYAVFGEKLFSKTPFGFKYKRTIELNKLLLKTLTKDIFKKNKLKGFKLTGVGYNSCKLTLLLNDKTEYWSGCFLIEELPSKVDFLKQKYEEAQL